MNRWPDFFIVGAPKAGTTSLYEYLKDVPGIFLPERKEPKFFSRINIPEISFLQPVRDKQEYLNLFAKAKEEDVVGEASPSYLSDPEAPKLIHEVNPNAKIIIILRDPVERAISGYLMKKKTGMVDQSFHKELDKVISKYTGNKTSLNLNLRNGFYAEEIKKYWNIFGKEQVKILIFEECFKNSKNTVQDIIDFLGINYKITNLKTKIFNPYSVPRGQLSQKFYKNSKIRMTAVKVGRKLFSAKERHFIQEKILLKTEKKPEIDEKDRNSLKKLYFDDVKSVELILNKNLPWKNFHNISD